MGSLGGGFLNSPLGSTDHLFAEAATDHSIDKEVLRRYMSAFNDDRDFDYFAAFPLDFLIAMPSCPCPKLLQLLQGMTHVRSTCWQYGCAPHCLF